ncbi:MAG TPA: arsenate reductase family protein [Candidatus Monoglobus merdigallinarum]|uniref:Arsenate reductase family protein n=1 Tax=Candidatus Monoglobus merdigallinarum TaxID=2838698 RepID=A0A9D1TKY3_9FIRM|nr:arsenate reductase family protein [Candidatus Monoglobus merdigallinarum]
MEFVCYKNCSTCKKAQKWLDENGIEYILRDIKSEKPTASELKTWYKNSGLPLKRFFNTSGMLYRSLGLKDKLNAMTEDEMLELLASDGMLVKRPIIVDGERVLVGFKEDAWSVLI